MKAEGPVQIRSLREAVVNALVHADSPQLEDHSPQLEGDSPQSSPQLVAEVTPALPRSSRVDRVDSILEDLAYDESAAPIWEQLSAIGQQAPPSAWEAVPTDLSVRLDEIVYGAGASRA